MPDITLPNGQIVRTGLLVPDQRLTRFKAYAANAPVLSDNEIRDIIRDPNRVSSRVRFPQQVWSKNQGNLSSCNGWAASRGLGKCRVLRGLRQVHLSGTFVYAHINGGRDEGSMLDDGMSFIMETGVCREELVPILEYRLNRVSAEAKADAKNYKAFECYRIDTRQELLSANALGFITVVAVHVPRGNGWTFTDSKGRTPPSSGVGNHAVHCDDIVEIDGKFYLDMDYDWGMTVGQDGKGYISFEDHMQETIQNHVFYALRSSNDGLDSLNWSGTRTTAA